MKISKITKPYRNYNEDGIIIFKNYYIVLDGATTLYDDQSNQTSSLASELVNYTKERLPKLLEQYDLVEAIDILSKESYVHFNFNTTEPARLPSMGIAAAKIEKKYTTFYLLGDLRIMYQNKNKNIYSFFDSRLDKLDQKSIELIGKGKKRSEILKILIRHRNMLGEMYQAFIPSLKPQFEFQIRTVLTKNQNEILVFSDGYYSLRTPFNIVKNKSEFLNYDIYLAAEAIKKAAYCDENLTKYKRLKVIDDISAIKISL